MSSDGQPEQTAVVLPLGDSATTDPWELLARGEGAILHSAPSPGTGTDWRKPLRATSALAQGLSSAAAATTQAVSATGQRFVLQMPGGSTDSLVRAVGGGYRGVATNATGTITGQVRLLPMGPKAVMGAMGPVGVGLLALTVASEMLGGDEQARTLGEIASGVERLTARLELDDEAELRTAEQTIETAHAALLDGATIPESVGLGAAMRDLQVIRNRSVALLDGWEHVVGECAATTSGSELREKLGNVGALGWEGFGLAVHTAYRAIALDSRRTVLTATEAQLRNPGAPLSAFRAAVDADLAARADEVRRMRTLFTRLAATPLMASTFSGRFLPAFASDEAADNARTQALFAHLAAALAPQASLPTSVRADTITMDSRPDGTARLIRPV
ncbi:hypothetical protein [Pseudonocardia spirodelae]|uniref:Uncharacterized protein n=1 Tax=Pseudonocardia spirodelae TaxID=3133431 RepID=A0ABU8TDP3_9PSEU